MSLDPDKLGIVYCLSNPAMPALVKVGMTRWSAATRQGQLSTERGVPEPFAFEWAFLVDDCEAVEAHVFSVFDRFRVKGREFLQLDKHVVECLVASLGYKPVDAAFNAQAVIRSLQKKQS
jgi:hypothetical protein